MKCNHNPCYIRTTLLRRRGVIYTKQYCKVCHAATERRRYHKMKLNEIERSSNED